MLDNTLRNMAAGLLVWALIVGALGLVSIGQSDQCLDGQVCAAETPVYSPTGNRILVQDSGGRPSLAVREIQRF